MARKTPFEWIEETLKEDRHIDSINIINENLLHIRKDNGILLRITKSSLNRYFLNDIKEILKENDVDFILHTSKEPFVDGSVIEYLDSKKKVLGGFGDVIRVVNQEHNWPYLPPDVKFIKRGLEQHTKVSNVRRLDHKRYEITRYGLETVVVIALDDYDLGIESIRSAAEEFDSFDAVLKSNPNGSITSSAIEHVNSRNIKVLKWGELMGKLNLRWK
jgi:hypothetical protein